MNDRLAPGTRTGRAPLLSVRHRLRVAAIVAMLAGCFGCDRATKRVAVALLPEGRRVSLLSDCIRLEHVRNPGAFLSLGAGLPRDARAAVFTWGVGILVVGALVAAFHPRVSTRTALAAALVAGGGLGNLWDRVTSDGLVTDFMNLGIAKVRTGIFNVADLAIVAGVLILAFTPRKPAQPSS